MDPWSQELPCTPDVLDCSPVFHKTEQCGAAMGDIGWLTCGLIKRNYIERHYPEPSPDLGKCARTSREIDFDRHVTTRYTASVIGQRVHQPPTTTAT